MLTDAIPSFIFRMVGPFLFVSAVTCFLVMYGYQETQLRLAKATYLNDAVYSQADNDEEYADAVSSTEIIGILLSNPTIDIKILGDRVLVSVEPLTNGSMYVTVEQVAGELSKGLYAKTIYNFQGFNMNYVSGGYYSEKQSYNANGELESITYTLIQE